MKYYLYTITNKLNNKIYVGQTINPKRRWADHKWLSQNKQEQYIHRAMNKWGVNNFTYEIIATCCTEEDANETERLLIIQYDSQSVEHGYNIAPGGNSAWNYGLPKDQQPMYGKKQSEYFKQRMSEVHTGKLVIHSQETKDKISASHVGYKMSDETKGKISLAHFGKTISNETKNKMSIAATGIHAGEKHGRAKLNDELVRQIRIEYLAEKTTYRKLALKYKIATSTINDIINYKTWKHVL